MFRTLRLPLLFLTLSGAAAAFAADVDPLQLAFHRQSVRRFVFSGELPLGKFAPGETVALDAMHPAVPTPGAASCTYGLAAGKLEATAAKENSLGDSAFYVSGINPYATYRLDVSSVSPGAEAALEFATLDRRTRVQVIATSAASNFLTLRVIKDARVIRETPLATDAAPDAPYTLRVQLSGVTLAAFETRNGQTRFLGHTSSKEDFGDVIDFRSRATLAGATFNIATRVPPGGRVVLGEAAAALTSGVGQADIRQITHADGAPFIENNRFWFTFSSRGIGLADSCQGVMSVDPSVFDPRFEGVIVFDRNDGLLRNDYASHVFYDDDAREWRAVTCCFSTDPHGRGPTGLAFAHSPHDPRRGFSVLSETQLAPDQIPTHHEDPCLIHDTAAGKWRLLTSCFEPAGLRAELFESDRWDGTYTKVAGPVDVRFHRHADPDRRLPALLFFRLGQGAFRQRRGHRLLLPGFEVPGRDEVRSSRHAHRRAHLAGHIPVAAGLPRALHGAHHGPREFPRASPARTGVTARSISTGRTRPTCPRRTSSTPPHRARRNRPAHPPAPTPTLPASLPTPPLGVGTRAPASRGCPAAA